MKRVSNKSIPSKTIKIKKISKKIVSIPKTTKNVSYANLPPDAMRELASFLPLDEILKLCTLNKAFNNAICKNDKFWQNKFIKDVGTPNISPTNYRQAYIKAINSINSILRPYIDTIKEQQGLNLALVEASKRGYDKIVKKLITEGANIEYTSPSFLPNVLALTPPYFPFVEAAANGQLAALKILDEAYVNAKAGIISPQYETTLNKSLKAATENDFPNIVDYIISNYYNILSTGYLDNLITENDVASIKILKHVLSNYNIPKRVLSAGLESLIRHIFFSSLPVEDYYEVLDLFVKNGADINFRFGDSLIFLIIRLQDDIDDEMKERTYKLIEYLIKHGANLDVRGGQPLVEAILKGNYALVKLLVDNGADVHFDHDYPIRLAAERKNRKRILDYLRSHA